MKIAILEELCIQDLLCVYLAGQGQAHLRPNVLRGVCSSWLVKGSLEAQAFL